MGTVIQRAFVGDYFQIWINTKGGLVSFNVSRTLIYRLTRNKLVMKFASRTATLWMYGMLLIVVINLCCAFHGIVLILLDTKGCNLFLTGWDERG